MPNIPRQTANAIPFIIAATILVAFIGGASTVRQNPLPRATVAADDDLPGDIFAGGRSVNTPKSPAKFGSKSGQVEVKTAPGVLSPKKGTIRLERGVPETIAGATRIHQTGSRHDPLALTIVLNRTDQAGFDEFLRDVQDPQSPSYRHYLSPRGQADRFGPSAQAYDEVSAWLRREGLRILEGSANRLTLTVDGTRKRAELAFGVEISDYRIGDGTFYANDRDPAIPARIAPYVQAVIGLSNRAKPEAGELIEKNNRNFCFDAAVAEVIYDPQLQHCETSFGQLPCAGLYEIQLKKYENACLQSKGLKPKGDGNGPPGSPFPSSSESADFRRVSGEAATSGGWSGVDGRGQTVGLLEFDTFNINDVRDFLALASYPSADINRLSQVHVNGGATVGPQESEVLMDIIAVMTNARGAKVVVYDAPFTGIRTSFQTLFNKMISDGVTVISNSWVYCEDQASFADAQSIDSVLASASAAGITVLNSTGDFGSTCVNGSANTASMPASCPHATAVGGTSLTSGPASTYGSELFWNGLNETPPTGAGGFGVSRFFSRPAYQNGFTNSPMRSVPDISVNADPAKGLEICQADAGGCPTGAQYGGTSLSAPLWAAFVALLNQAQGQNLGELNPMLYPLGNTNAFHSAASMGSDFQHVGLGSPNLNLVYRTLTNKTAGSVSGSISEVTADPPGAVADGTSEVFVVVQLRDADGNTVSGKTVALTGNSGSHAKVTTSSGNSNIANGAVVFSVKDNLPEFVTFTATDTTDNIVLQNQVEVAFITRPATAGGIVASPTTVTANGSDATTITVTLQDANGNPSPNKLVNLSQGNGASIISATSAITDATGKVQFTAVSNKDEIVTYSAVDVTDRNLPIPGNAMVAFVNASGFCANRGAYNFGTAAPGYAVTTFAGNFPVDCFSGVGPIGIAFDSSNTLFVASNNTLYAFGQQGGLAGPTTKVGAITPSTGVVLGLAFGQDGRLYAAMGNKVVELNPGTAAVIRTVVDLGGADAKGLAIDPLSGDLFVSQGFDGIKRVSNFMNGPATATPYGSPGEVDGIVFAPDGTLYAADDFGGGIARVAGTNTATPGAKTIIAFLNKPDGLAIESNSANLVKPFLYANRNDGVITRIDTSALPDTPTNPCATGCTDIYTGGSRGDFVTVSPAGCLYATQSERVIRITKADGTCSLTPTSVLPQIALTPENVQPSPAQGTTVTFTAQLKNVAALANVPVTLFITGANPSPHLVRTDANGKAIITYTGVFTGIDQAFASADIGGTTVFSNESQVAWTPGKHSTFLTVNQSPSSGSPNKPLMLSASLVDFSASPAAPVNGASIVFSLAGQTCSAIANVSGMASCSITPTVAPGSYPLIASFAATSTLLASSASKTVDLVEAVNQTVVQFSSSSYNVQEDCTTVTITVNRVGDASGAASVDYFTSDGTASERRDYITALGTLQFAAGETSKSFLVLINEDSYIEGSETLNINLGNPSNVALGVPAIATVTITDDVTEPATNPIDDPRTYVCQHYHDFLNRQPDPSGWDFWTNQITSCGNDAACTEAKRINVSGAFFLSIEFQQTGYLVERMYKVAYGDAAGASTLGGSHQLPVPIIRFKEFLQDTQRIGRGVVVLQPGWEQLLESNKQAYAGEFVQTPRFITALPVTMTPAQFVDKLNQNAGNVLSASERATAINQFGGASDSSNITARTLALRQVAEDQDLYNAESNRAFVLAQYFGYLRRDSNDPQDTDFTGYDFWLTKLNQFNGDYIKAEMVKAFISSSEYRQRFGQ
jgi:hypothetical protein